MAITYKLFLDERTPKGNKFSLKLRVTYNRKHRVIPLNVDLAKEHWNADTQKIKPSHPNSKLISIKINQLLNEIQEKALKFETTDKIYNVDSLITMTNGRKSSPTFLEFANSEIDNLIKVGRIGNANAYKDATNRLIKFIGNTEIRLESIDFKLLEKFANTMLSEGIKVNTVALYMREIRAIYNKAINADVVEQKYYPFHKYKIKTAKTISRALSIDDMKKIVRLELQHNTPIWNARNYFLLSFCLIGTNCTDLFKLTTQNIHENRVVFNRSKTHKIYSIYVHPKTKELVSHYNNINGYYLLPILKNGDTSENDKKHCKQAIKTINEYLSRIAEMCGIEQKVTTYYARYTWANIAKSLGYSKDLIAEALGHEYGNKVTGIYLNNYDSEIIDLANEKVISVITKP